MSDQEEFSGVKLYKMVLDTKHHEEERRDEINKYYTSLFTGIVALGPLVERFADGHSLHGFSSFRIILLSLGAIGAAISVSWILTLKRIYNYVEILDKLLVNLEKKYNQSFIIFVSEHLYKIHSPGRVTKQAMIMPITFLITLLVGILYNSVYLY